jgi:hypothetical protein
MSSQAFHRTPCGHVRKITVSERLELRHIELFDLIAQDRYQDEYLQRSRQKSTQNWTFEEPKENFKHTRCYCSCSLGMSRLDQQPLHARYSGPSSNKYRPEEKSWLWKSAETGAQKQEREPDRALDQNQAGGEHETGEIRRPGKVPMLLGVKTKLCGEIKNQQRTPCAEVKNWERTLGLSGSQKKITSFRKPTWAARAAKICACENEGRARKI